MQMSRVIQMLFAAMAFVALGAWTGTPDASAQTATGVRNLPDTYRPGETITVTIDLTVTGTPIQAAVAEGLPSDEWVLVSANPTPAVAAGRSLGWFFQGATGNGVRITYTVRAPANATGSQNFDGVVSAVTMTGTIPSIITGDTVVNPEGGATGFAVTAVRDLPSSYQAGVEFDVTLQVTVPATRADGFEIVESPPGSNLLEFVSANPTPDSQDSDTNDMIWSFSGANVQNRTITYRMRPKTGVTIALPFVGTVMSSLAGHDNEVREIGGDFLIPGDILPTIIPTTIPTITFTPIATFTPGPTPTGEPTASPTPVASEEVALARTLPNTYTVGQNVNYTIAIDIIASGVKQLAVSEHIPAGWTPVSANPEWTTYTEEEHLLVWKYGPLPAPVDGPIESTVAPAQDSVGPKVFVGGFEYTILEGITPRVGTGVILGDALLLPSASQPGPVTISRTLPALYAPGVNVNASLAVNVDDSAPPTMLMIQEGTPPGWTMVSANPPYTSYSDMTGIAVWNLNSGSPIADQTITYVITPPNDASGPYAFAGAFEYSSGGLPQYGAIEGNGLISNQPISPDLQALVQAILGAGDFPDGADINQDGAADVADIIRAITSR